MARRPRGVTSVNKDFLLNEAARRSLPVARYLMMLDMAARTGQMPVVDELGKFTGEAHELKPEQRIDLAKYLINKVLPDLPKEVYHSLNAPAESASLPIERLGNASADVLRAIAAGTPINDASFTAIPEPE